MPDGAVAPRLNASGILNLRYPTERSTTLPPSVSWTDPSAEQLAALWSRYHSTDLPVEVNRQQREPGLREQAPVHSRKLRSRQTYRAPLEEASNPRRTTTPVTPRLTERAPPWARESPSALGARTSRLLPSSAWKGTLPVLTCHSHACTTSFQTEVEPGQRAGGRRLPTLARADDRERRGLREPLPEQTRQGPVSSRFENWKSIPNLHERSAAHRNRGSADGIAGRNAAV
jgi:hypothetical protein